MKWMIVLLVFLLLRPASAAQQYSTYQCDNLRERIEFIRKRISSGNDIVAASATDIRDKALIQEYATHCRYPVDTVRVVRGASKPSGSSAENENTALQDMPNFSANNSIYTGKKARDWADFYQPPRQCRQKQLTDSEFVFCAEHKADQRAKFELIWQSQFPEKSSQVERMHISGEYMPQKSIQIGTIATTGETESRVNEFNHKSYLQALDEQNQNFKWYGVILIVFMAAAGLLVWRR